MNKKEFNHLELMPYILLFLVAAGVRFFFLGSESLLESEAVLAFRSWELSTGEILAPGENTLYESFTALIFSIFGSGNLLARTLPALAGSLIIWLPYLLRERLGHPAALVGALGFALDPGLVVASRQIGSPMLAAALILFAAGFFVRQKTFAGTLLALSAFFAGNNIWLGIIGLLLVAGISDWAGYLSLRMVINRQISRLSSLERSERFIILFLPLLFAGALVTQFFQIPSGLSAWLQGLPSFLGTWFSPTSVPANQLIILLLVNAPLALGYGLLAILQSWRENDETGKILSLWFGVSLLLSLIYPGRTALDLIWALIPLWLLAGRQISTWMLRWPKLWVTWVFGSFIFVITVLNWLSVTGLLYRQVDPQANWLQVGLSGASVLLIVLTMVIIASEWDWNVAGVGAHMGISTALFLYGLSALNLGAYSFSGDPRSLWVGAREVEGYTLLKETLDEISLSETGRRDSISGAVFGGGTSLKWELRNYHNLEFYPTYSDGLMLPVVITDEENTSAELEDYYWGQDFPETVRKAWQGLLPEGWISWLAFREAPVERSQLFLWVREDVLPWVITEEVQ